jgi:hypothetical protein
VPTDDDQATLRSYAQRENDYVLSLLLKPKEGKRAEDPYELAERNCGATERSFGKLDPLHAMALNTFAFAQLHKKNSKKREIAAAREAAANAAEIVRNIRGQEQLLLESQFISVLAGVRAGGKSSASVLEVFAASARYTDELKRRQAATEALGKILIASVFERRLERILQIMVLRDISEALLSELQANHDDLNKAFMSSFGSFLDAYYERQ